MDAAVAFAPVRAVHCGGIAVTARLQNTALQALAARLGASIQSTEV